jgi:hypothetical protein
LSTFGSIGQSSLRNRRRRIAAIHDSGLALRTEIDANFEEPCTRHVTELGELQARLMVEYRTEVANPRAAYDTLVREARANAVRGDFERAQTHRKPQSDRWHVLRRQTAEMAAIGTFEVDRNWKLDETITKFRRDVARAYKAAVADISSPAERKVVDRRIVVESLNALEDA